MHVVAHSYCRTSGCLWLRLLYGGCAQLLAVEEAHMLTAGSCLPVMHHEQNTYRLHCSV
jgi:hypothetical protein